MRLFSALTLAVAFMASTHTLAEAEDAVSVLSVSVASQLPLMVCPVGTALQFNGKCVIPPKNFMERFSSGEGKERDAVTPSAYLSAACPGATITQFQVGFGERTEGPYINNIAIYFSMPVGGCKVPDMRRLQDS